MYYAGSCAHALGCSVDVLACVPEDFPIDAVQRQFPFRRFGNRSGSTTVFENRYQDGRRTQHLLMKGDAIEGGLPEDVNPELVLLCPVMDELLAPITSNVRGRTTGACLQGWLRVADASGLVSPNEELDFLDSLKGVDVLFYSEEDIGWSDPPRARIRSCAPVVIETLGKQGAVVYQGDREVSVPGTSVVEVDPTGAGDTFAMAFLIHWHRCGDVVEAARMACQSAALEVSQKGPLTKESLEKGLVPEVESNRCLR